MKEDIAVDTNTIEPNFAEERRKRPLKTRRTYIG